MDSSGLPPSKATHTPGAAANTPASSSSTPLAHGPQRSPSQSSLHRSGHAPSHRQSFAENLRNPPPSPRSQRHPSFTQQAIQDLVNHPPPNRQANPRFTGRDWRDVTVGELVSQEDVSWAEPGTSVEEATMTLLKSKSAVVLVRENATSEVAVSTFDSNDLNAYLLVVVGLAKPEEAHISLYDSVAKRAQGREAIPLRDIEPICRKDPVVRLAVEQNLTQAVEVLGSGIHRILVTDGTSKVVGVLDQLKLLEFFWNEGINFPAIDRLYPVALRDLPVGSQKIIAINADSPLADALTLMYNEGLTSVAVVDNGLNVTGNISTADVRHLTTAASLPLLQSTCMHFISVILSERGVEKGRDSFPVFYVNPYSTLASAVAKLVATNSHRLWVVESASPSPSAPATPLLAPVTGAGAGSSAATSSGNLAATTSGETTILIPSLSGGAAPLSPLPVAAGVAVGFASSVSAAALPGAHLSGRLTGVVSLSDILNLFAKSSGLNPADPGEQRARRRRSSASSNSMRPSFDGPGAGFDIRRP